MRTLEDIEFVSSAVSRTATFRDAAKELVDGRSPIVAVLDERRAVVGLFGQDQLLRGLFPKYLEDLHHTAFATDDLGVLRDRAETVAREPVERHMVPATTVEADSSAIHVAERFLHSRLPGLPVVERGEFVGVLTLAEFCRAIAEPRATPRDA